MAKIGFGLAFQRETDTPDTYASLGELVDGTPPTMTRETVDATHHGSANRVRRFIGGLRDAGEAEAVIHYEPGGTAWDDLKADYDDDDPHNYKIVFPADSGTPSVTFSAFVTELGPATPLADKMVLRAKFKLDGAGTWS